MKHVALSKTQLAAISRLFSASVVRDLSEHGKSAQFVRLITETPLSVDTNGQPTVGETYERAFRILRQQGNRDAYIYQAAIAQRILMGVHSLSTAAMVTEFRAGACKADVVVLNGTATAYEIKSERDTLSRLKNQIENYKKVFARTFIITSEDQAEAVASSTSPEIGVLYLNKRNSISTIRDAETRPEKTCSRMMLSSVRRAEALEMLNFMKLQVPDVPNTRIFASICDIVAEQPPEKVHEAMVAVLKQTRSQSALAESLEDLPQSIKPAALSMKLKPRQIDKLKRALQTPLCLTPEWAA